MAILTIGDLLHLIEASFQTDYGEPGRPVTELADEGPTTDLDQRRSGGVSWVKATKASTARNSRPTSSPCGLTVFGRPRGSVDGLGAQAGRPGQVHLLDREHSSAAPPRWTRTSPRAKR